MYGLKILGTARGDPEPKGWLQSMDFEAHGPGMPYPTGRAVLTDDPRRARKFETAAEALVFWRRPSRLFPTRPDGKPNRPLTAFNALIEELPDPDTVQPAAEGEPPAEPGNDLAADMTTKEER